MPDFNAPEYSNRQVIRAGKRLRGKLLIVDDEAVETFKIAHNWRAAHILPMRHLRAELNGKVRRVGEGLTAARLKRMSSIRAKLRRGPHSLLQMQDIAGCRAIMPTQDDADYLVALYRKSARHIFVHEDDYIRCPKTLGYRGHHLVFRYNGRGQFAPLNSKPQFVEIQVRTRLQHAWATAVEAVGMVRGEELKAGEGHKDWLRLFSLMASELATLESAQLVPGTPTDPKIRRNEILALERKLDALASLSKYRTAVKIAESAPTSSPYYLIQFDAQTNQLHVRGVSPSASATSLDEAERSASLNSVLVEVDKVSDLKSAYPNYFMDVALFEDRLRKLTYPSLDRPPVINKKWLSGWLRGKR